MVRPRIFYGTEIHWNTDSELNTYVIHLYLLQNEGRDKTYLRGKPSKRHLQNVLSERSCTLLKVMQNKSNVVQAKGKSTSLSDNWRRIRPWITKASGWQVGKYLHAKHNSTLFSSINKGVVFSAQGSWCYPEIRIPMLPRK